MIAMTKPDWYARREELLQEQIFRTYDGHYVKLDRTVPGDGSKWYVADWCNGHWSYEDGTIEPGDLIDLLSDVPSDDRHPVAGNVKAGA